MEPLDKLKTSLHEQVDREVAEVQAHRRREETARLAAYDEERKAYQHQIEDLQAQVTKLESITAENARLKAQVTEYQKNEPDEAARITHYDYSRLKSTYDELQREFRRAMQARGMIETELRHAKENLREWKKYCNDWVQRRPKRRLSSAQAQHALSASHDEGRASDPPPPSYPDTTIPSSGGSMVSPPQRRPLDIRNQTQPASSPRILARNTDVHDAPESEGMIETMGDGAALPTLASEAGKPRQSKISQGPSASKMDDTGGSSPIIVSERSLKRKQPKIHVNIHKDASNVDDLASRQLLKREKTDHRSSSPLQTSRLANQQGIAGGSLDLDEVEGTLWTPRKRQRIAESRLRKSTMANHGRHETQYPDDLLRCANSPGVSRQNDQVVADESLPFEGRVASPNREDKTAVDEDLDVVLPKHVGKGHAQKVRKDARKDDENAHHECAHRRSISKTSQDGDSTKEGDLAFQDPEKSGLKLQERRRGDKLQTKPSRTPRSRNPALPRTSSTLTSKKRQWSSSCKDRGAVAVPALAEDRDELTVSKLASHPSKAKPKDSRQHFAMDAEQSYKVPDTSKRLDILLNIPSPPSAALGLTANVRRSREVQASSTSPKRIDQPSFGTPLSVPSGTRNNDSIVSKLQSDPQPRFQRPSPIPSRRDEPKETEAPTDIRPEHEPLRARPAHRLRLEDFKLNPRHSNYAYHETIRKHDDKKARGGCTDPFCTRCEELRKYAEMSGYVAPRQNRLFDSSPPKGADTTIDINLLRDFLGGDTNRIRRMSAKEKEDAMREANKKHFMDTFGKHKQTFSKPPEMPGFWETEFPTTQENERYNEEVRVIEREKVGERRQEAMRKGMWLFADEMEK